MEKDPTFERGAAIIFGASGGVGGAVARAFAQAGSDVALIWRSKESAARSLADEIETLGRKSSLHQCDVCEDGAAQAAVDAAVRVHGRIHTLIWGAGPLAAQTFIADVSDEQWRRAVDVEVHGFFRATKAVIVHMRGAGGGSIVHLGSAGDLRWPDKDVLSVAPKAANEALVKGIAREKGRHGVRANSILLGVIEAGMFLELTKQGAFDEAWINEVHKNLAIKRWGKPEEVGATEVFLASSAAGYVTGQQIAVAGGYGL